MRETEIENGVIESTMLGIEDHGIASSYITVKGDGWGCGFGGYTLDGPYDHDKKKRLPSALMGWWVARVMETVGVEKWEDLKGKHVRVETEGLGGHIIALGHFMKKQWFRPGEEIKVFLAANPEVSR
jgi:hypothetical protein